MFQRFILALAVASILCIGSRALADDTGKANQAEQQFLKCAALDNLTEIKLSEAAQSQAQDQKVKDFAQQMINDHKQANDQLKQVADKKGIQLPTELTQERQEGIQAIQSLQGKDFDCAYISAAKAGHLEALSKYQDMAAVCKDPDIKQFAQQIVPKLQQHAQQVMSLAQAQGLPTSGLGEAQPAGARITPDQSSNSYTGSTPSGQTPGASDAGRTNTGTSGSQTNTPAQSTSPGTGVTGRQ